MAESASTEDVVYDSQEEFDQWPDSQPYERGPLIETAPNARSSGKLQSSQTVTTLDDLIAGLDFSPPSKPVSTSPLSRKSTPATSQPNATPSAQTQKSHPSKEDNAAQSDKPRIADIFDFESSDDDVPLEINRPSSQPPKSPSPPPNDTHTEEPNDSTLPRRALRARKPEQQMPYTLDLLRHRDQFRRRGLKPVHNPSDRPKVRREDDGDQYHGDEEDVGIDQDEIYHPPKTTEERALKKRRVEPIEKNRFPDLPKVRIHREIPDFQDPRMFDIRRDDDKLVESPQIEKSYYDFTSDEEVDMRQTDDLPSISPLRPRDATPRPDLIYNSPLSTNPTHPVPRRIIPISSDESDPSSQSESRASARSPSASSSDTGEDMIERFKKKARGVLPGSFFTVHANDQPKSLSTRHNPTNYDRDRKGLAKTKVNHSAGPRQFAYPITAHDEEDEEEEAPRQSPEKERRNFVDLTREETIDDWDIEEDLIDRMLNWGRSNPTTTRPRPKNQVRKNKPKTSHCLPARPKRKRQHRINEFTVSDPRKAPAKRSGPKLSIVDACDIHTTRASESPPQFMKLARRQLSVKPDFGRKRAPNRKLFSFAEREDQDDVQTVITEWENGSIAETIEPRKWTKPPPSRLGPRRVTGPKILARPRAPPVGKENVEPRDKTKPVINKFIRPGAPIIAVIGGEQSRGRVLPHNKVYSTGEIVGTTRLRNTGPVHRPATRRHRADDVAAWLRSTVIHDESNYLDPIDLPGQMDDGPPRPRAQVRKLVRPSRRDVNKFDKRFRRGQHVDVSAVHQLSLDDIWFTNDSTSLTFGVTPLADGVYLNSSTLMGNQLVAKALKTQPVETEPRLWAQPSTTIEIDVDVACDRLAADLDQILDSIDDNRLSNTPSPRFIRSRLLDFADFIIPYLANSASSNLADIQTFGSKQMRLTEMAMDRLDGTILSGTLDLNDDLCLVALSVVQTLLVACYQLCVVTSHDVSMLGANEILSKLSRQLLQYLLNGGFEPVQQAIRRTRGGTTDGGGCDSILLDIWSTLYHLLNNPSNPETFRQFWKLLESELEVSDTKDGQLLDRAWYTLLNISPTTLFNTAGISQPRTNRPPTATTTIWSIVETLITPFLQSYSAAQHHRYDAYIRTLLGRCHTLIGFWGWSSGAKTLLTTIYTFFTERRFDNLKTEALTPGFPKFFQSDPTRIELHTSDNTFIIFLKLIVSYIALESGRLAPLPRRDRQAGWKDLDRFVNRVIPLRTYQASFTPLDYIALQNHYCLMVTLYWVAPERSRPSVERMRDVIDIEMAPAPAQVICLDTWKVLARLMVGKGEELDGMKEWFGVMFRHAMKEVRGVRMEEQNKSKMRNLESVVVKGMLALAEIVPLAIEGLASLVEDVTDQLVKSSHEILASLTIGLLNLLTAFFDAVDKKFVVPTFQPPPPAFDEDSQDYGDSAFLEEFIAVQETSNFPVGQNISTICTHLYRVVANVFASAPKSQPVGQLIDAWIHGLSILVAHRLQDWTTFLQYGGEWERLRSTNSRMSRAWGPVILTKILRADPTAYFQGQEHFISAWFESIIEADLDGQHALTELLLNIDDGGTILENSVFAKNTEGIYRISADALFEARPTLIVHALANMGKHFEQLVRERDNAAIAVCKQRYLDYLHRMLSSMKSIYLEMKDTESDDLIQYISLSQHVVGNIIQYCPSFLKEIDRTFKDLPILDYFLSGETFPQPGSNEIGYAAQRLRGIARKDPNAVFSHGTQSDIFWSVKTYLERAMQNSREEEFVEFMVLALGVGEGVGDHARLRRFVVDMFCEYFWLATEMPVAESAVWGYVVPISRCVRDVFASLWETMMREDMESFADLLDMLGRLSIAMFGVVEIVLDQARAGQAPYTLVCARIFDFMIFVDHVLFYTNDIPGLAGKLTLLERILELFRGVAKEDEMGDWGGEVGVEMLRGDNAYIQPTIRREMQMFRCDMPMETSKLQEILNVLLSEDSKSLLDDGIAMYI